MASTVSLAARTDPARGQDRPARPADSSITCCRSLDDDFPELFKIAAEFDDRIERTPQTTRCSMRSFIAGVVRREKLLRVRPRRGGAGHRAGRAARRRCRPAVRPACARSSIFCRRPTRSRNAAAGSFCLSRRGAGCDRRQVPPRRPHLSPAAGGDRPQHHPHRNRRRRKSARSTGFRCYRSAGSPSATRPASPRRVRLGRGEVVDIEREVALGGPLHSKGVLILSGFLGGRYRPDAAAVVQREPRLRAILWRGRRRQRVGSRTLRAAVGVGRSADPAILRRHRLGRPARPHPGDRRRQREDRGIFRRVPPGRA